MTDPYPPWARWIAQDEDGFIHVFGDKPYLRSNNYWIGVYLMKCIGMGKPNPHWQHSLDWLGEDDET